ncbi:hypothetical protein BDZ85DRAFT_268972 [Elsinoe ampelina]|uniref:Uncharacterized protein n=1 Tax=Elsinoe ampelina TaxID=302913 RepID=A0A6A6G146_9PEZI|nr:hypothetical protein BDZ85DRAFT_268972 [Elsinoe ampelina]
MASHPLPLVFILAHCPGSLVCHLTDAWEMAYHYLPAITIASQINRGRSQLTSSCFIPNLLDSNSDSTNMFSLAIQGESTSDY